VAARGALPQNLQSLTGFAWTLPALPFARQNDYSSEVRSPSVTAIFDP